MLPAAARAARPVGALGLLVLAVGAHPRRLLRLRRLRLDLLRPPPVGRLHRLAVLVAALAAGVHKAHVHPMDGAVVDEADGVVVLAVERDEVGRGGVLVLALGGRLRPHVHGALVFGRQELELRGWRGAGG